MKESQKNENKKPGLEEALHPEIANESLWATDPHIYSLSTVDPLKSLDQHLLDEATAKKNLDQWKAQWNGEKPDESIPKTEANMVDHEIALKPGSKLKEQKSDKTEEAGRSITPIHQEENVPAPDSKEFDSEPKKEKKKKEKDSLKASKRIRKLAEKVQKEEDERNDKDLKISAPVAETNLSPFTYWLKGLTGSEYVHPYEDDFAFNQGSARAGEGISETFADLLASQGYKDQAIAMYTRLIEKFPEKSRFFAAKIEALQ